MSRASDLVQQQRPRTFYRGTDPSITQRIHTDDPEWDKHLFASSRREDTKLYAGSGPRAQIATLQAEPDARILYEGTAEWRKVAGSWHKNENMLQYAGRAARQAKAAGYHAAHFHRQGDIGTAIFDPSKFKTVHVGPASESEDDRTLARAILQAFDDLLNKRAANE